MALSPRLTAGSAPTSHGHGTAHSDLLCGSEAVLCDSLIAAQHAAMVAIPHLIVVCEAEPSLPPGRACATLLASQQSDWELLPRGVH